MTHDSLIEWNRTTNRKPKKMIEKELAEIIAAYRPKPIRTYEENGIKITVYEGR